MAIKVNFDDPLGNQMFYIQKFSGLEVEGVVYDGIDIFMIGADNLAMEGNKYEMTIVSESEISVKIPKGHEQWKRGENILQAMREQHIHCDWFKRGLNKGRMKYLSDNSRLRDTMNVRL
jgi:hypothetical protein